MARFNVHEVSGLFGEYASGKLDPALVLLFETQAAVRADIAQSLKEADALAGAFFEDERPAALSADALAQTLERIGRAPRQAAPAKRAALEAGKGLDELIRLPEPLRALALTEAGSRGWKNAAAGIQRMQIDLDSAAEVELYRMEPGASAPKHTHAGQEATLVISGGFTDVSGSYGPGDISVKDDRDIHQPIADPGEVCFALSIRDGGIRLTGALGIVQRLFCR